jgi:hypothetical protein
MGLRNQRRVPVYAKDRETLLGDVAPSATSVGAAKVAGSETAVWTKVDGRDAWVAADYRR